MPTQRYIVVTPARNEEANIRHTLASMIGQTIRPSLWIIVDDGSKDATPTIVEEAMRDHQWIRLVRRPDRGARKQGGGVIEAFYDGYALIGDNAWDFLVKFDSDLSFDSNYFEQCLAKFTADPKLGIGGGMICQEHEGRLTCEAPGDPAFHVRGATKIYRRSCWEAIGGLLKAPGWDTVDELKANMLGWTTYTFKDVPLRHHRFTGSADGTWKNQVKFGLSNYIAGYHPLFMFSKCLKRLFQPPYFVGAIGLAWGFCKGYLHRVRQVEDPALIHYVRQQQINRLLFRPSLW
jgi:glycosyltransferase involved in cell wall biosynthesis